MNDPFEAIKRAWNDLRSEKPVLVAILLIDFWPMDRGKILLLDVDKLTEESYAALTPLVGMEGLDLIRRHVGHNRAIILASRAFETRLVQDMQQTNDPNAWLYAVPMYHITQGLDGFLCLN